MNAVSRVCLVVLVLVTCGVAHGQERRSPGGQARALGLRGWALCASGRFTDAERELRQAVALDATYQLGWSNLGWALVGQKRYADALVALEQAIRLEPRDSTAWTHKGVCLVRTGRMREAVDAYDRALELAPSNWAARRGRRAAFGPVR